MQKWLLLAVFILSGNLAFADSDPEWVADHYPDIDSLGAHAQNRFTPPADDLPSIIRACDTAPDSHPNCDDINQAVAQSHEQSPTDDESPDPGKGDAYSYDPGDSGEHK